MNHHSYSLALPPREVPSPVRLQVLFGGFSNQFGWFFLGFGLIFIWAFSGGAISELYFAVGRAETAPGTISEIRATSARENKVTVYANHYLFRIESAEKEYRGISYTTGQSFSVGQAVTIEYLKGNPQRSRIQGTRSSTFPWWAACMVIVFPAVGLGFVSVGFTQGLKGNRLLANGQVAQGKLVSKEPTNTRINKKTVYKLTFEFKTDEGQRYQAVARSHEPQKLQDEAWEQILYAPDNPNRSVLVDNLPGSPDIDELGRIQSASSTTGLLVLILPALVLLECGGALLLMLRG